MRTELVIELPHGADVEVPLDLLEAAYRASAMGAVVVVLPRSLRREVDRMLDPVVARVGPTACGVRYVEAGDEAAIHAALSRSSGAVPATAEFRSRCETLGVPVLDTRDLIARFRTDHLVEERRASIPSALFSSPQVAPAS